VNPGCFFAGRPGWGPCDGPLIRAHLIAKQFIKREVFSARRAQGLTSAQARAGVTDVAWDDRVWVPCCGGPTGIGGHHAELDSPLSMVRLPRAALPEGVEEFAAELDELIGREVFASWLDRTYGERR
jgi:hypothetical protein